jgi:predicted metal-dependent enzyme (double-stranded beta helix superfamily)
MADSLGCLRRFVCELTTLCDAGAAEADMREHGGAALSRLVAADDWLPPEFAQPDPAHYRQYLLYCDPLERFSVVSFVWGPGQRTPVHDHTMWGLIGVLRGAEVSRNYSVDDAGRLTCTGEERLLPGAVTAVSPQIGDIHQVENCLADRPSISIHAYGANIGAVARHIFAPEGGGTKPFVSGYANTMLPNLWDRSGETRARLGYPPMRVSAQGQQAVIAGMRRWVICGPFAGLHTDGDIARILLKKSKNRGRRKLAKLQSDGTLMLDAISVLLRTSHAA